MSPSELSRMFEDALASTDAWNAVRAADPTLSRRYALSADEWEIVRNNPTPDVLAPLGVPPLLAMWGSFICNPDFERAMSAREYFAATNGEH